MLILPIKRKWFDMIVEGVKKEEYRLCKPYWAVRIANERTMAGLCGVKPEVELVAGYSRSASRAVFEIDSVIQRLGVRHPEWGETDDLHYVLRLGRRLSFVGIDFASGD